MIEQVQQIMATKVESALFEYCRGKNFLLSKAVDTEAGFECLQSIYGVKRALEIKYGANMGSDTSRANLQATEFVEMKPLGPGKTMQNEELCLHHGKLSRVYARISTTCLVRRDVPNTGVLS